MAGSGAGGADVLRRSCVVAKMPWKRAGVLNKNKNVAPPSRVSALGPPSEPQASTALPAALFPLSEGPASSLARAAAPMPSAMVVAAGPQLASSSTSTRKDHQVVDSYSRGSKSLAVSIATDPPSRTSALGPPAEQQAVSVWPAALSPSSEGPSGSMARAALPCNQPWSQQLVLS